MRVLTAAPEVTSSRVSSAGCLRRVRGAVPCRASAPLQQCAGVRQGLRLAHGVQQRAVLRVNNRCSRALVVVSASATGKELVPDTEFTITKVSFGSIGLGVGLTLLVAGFLGYFNFVGSSADNSISALLLIYGFPISLIGFALKYAELQPLVCESYADAVALRATQATPIMQQVRSDVTRFRYGDEQHLDEALARIFRINKSGGIRRTQSPVLVRLREEVVNDKYALVLGFASALAFEEWETRRAKFESFFGPGVSAVLTQTENGVDVTLISDGSQAGGLADDEEVLPPLMPGLPPRVVKKGSKQPFTLFAKPMSGPDAQGFPAPQVANPFLEPQAAQQQLAFQEHNLGYQPASGNIGPSTTAAKFPPPPSSVPAPNFAGEPLLPPVGAQEQPPGKRGGFFSLDPYKKYFDVDTADVLYRLRLACVPVGSRFMETVQENPDLYGPFWVAATLVFLAAASGNLSTYFSYLRQVRTNPAATFSYDVTKVSLSAALFFGYITVLPLMWYIALRYWGSPTSPTALVSLYGYSLATFLPISVACVVPLDAVRWPIVLVGGAFGALFLMLNLRRLMDTFTDRKRKSIVLGMAGAGQMGLAVALKIYFFHFVVAQAPPGMSPPPLPPPMMSPPLIPPPMAPPS